MDKVSSNTALARLAIGLCQGAVLYTLYQVAESKVWPATEPTIFAPAFTIAMFIPLSALFAVGALRGRTLAGWLGVSTAVLVGLALHDLARRGGVAVPTWDRKVAGLPSMTMMISVSLAIFIAQSLVTAADRDRRAFAAYPSYFDIAWKLAIQTNFAFGFVGVMWGILFLGAMLFKLIGLDFLEKLIRHSWFAIPVSTLALAAALHLTDVRAGIVRAIRSLSSVLLSWLLPLLALILAGFLGSLPFTGLDLLWKTGHATALLLGAAAGLVILLNAAYQDGLPEHAPPLVLRVAGRVAAILILPLMTIAGYALYLRVAQHGWTVDRILASVCIAIGTIYGLGYTWATLRRGDWLKPLEPTNIVAAFATVATILALLSPLADPARIAVASQLDRLLSGRVAPEQFDFKSLRRWGGRYGDSALVSLAEDATASEFIRTQATQAMKAFTPAPPVAATTTDIAANIVSPARTPLPASFLRRDWTTASPSWQIPNCLKRPAERCDAFLLDLTGDGREDILLVPANANLSVLFAGTADGSWPMVATTSDSTVKCPHVLEALRAGQWQPVAPVAGDLEVAGRHLHLTPIGKPTPPCP